MPKFLLDHIDNCSPPAPCASCKALAYLRQHLKAEQVDAFLKIVAEGFGVQTPDPSHAELLQLPFEEVLTGLRTQTRNCLKNDNIVTIEDLISKPARVHIRMPFFGRILLKELEASLAEKGLKLISAEEFVAKGGSL